MIIFYISLFATKVVVLFGYWIFVSFRFAGGFHHLLVKSVSATFASSM